MTAPSAAAACRHTEAWRKEETFYVLCKRVLSDRKGGGVDEWPEDLRVRQFPEV